ncbi:MAG: hypothetical protein AAF705_13655 [Bacteroidota bacterium]
MKRLFVLIGCSLLIASCEEEKIVEVEREYSWKADDNFIYDNVVQMNSFATDDMLFFRGHTSFTSMVADSLEHPDYPDIGRVVHFPHWYTQSTDEKLPICADFFVSAVSNGFLAFIPNRDPTSQSASVSFNMKTLDENFGIFESSHFSGGEKIVINDQSQVLVPYKNWSPDGPYISGGPKLALINIKYDSTNTSFYHKLDTVGIQLLSIDDQFQNSTIALESIGSNFFVTTDTKVYRIDGDGRMVTVLDERLYKIFEDSGRLIGFGANNIFSSSDNGLTWIKGGETPWLIASVNFAKIDGKIIGYRYAQLWEVSTTETSFNFKELDNDGLDGKMITSVSEFDDKVFITSLSGVYRRPSDEFFTYKEPEDDNSE